MFIPDPDADFLPIPDPGVKKAPDPGSTTLHEIRGSSVVDPDSVNPDTDPDAAFQVNPDTDPGIFRIRVHNTATKVFHVQICILWYCHGGFM